MQPYTIPDSIQEQLRSARAADAGAVRGAALGPVPPAPQAPIAAPAISGVTQATPKVGALRSLANGVGQVFSKAGAAAGAGIGGALQSLQDNESGYRDQFNASVGAESPMAQVGADVARTLANVGNAATFGLAGRVGQGMSSVFAGESFGKGFSQSNDRDAFYQARETPKQSAVEQRVSKVIESNPALRTSSAPVSGPTGSALTQLANAKITPTSVDGISRVDGGPFKTPMFTDNPQRAAAEYGSNLSVIPSSADADRKLLQGAFQRYINSGDLEGARRTAVSADDMAALGLAEKQFVDARARDAEQAPLRRMMTELFEKASKEPARFGQPAGRRGQAAPDERANALALLQQLSPMMTQPQQPQTSPLAAVAAQAAARGQARATEVDTATKEQTLQSGQQMNALRAALAREKDPATRAQLTETIQVLTGKYEKPPAAPKLMPIDVDTGQKDVMGQPIYKKGLANPETGEIVSGAKQQPKTSRAALEQEAQAAIAAGANKDAVNKRLQEMLKQQGL
ncbi:MAG: hypothetical protein ACRCWJ_20175 [Casimicrobium sp.]